MGSCLSSDGQSSSSGPSSPVGARPPRKGHRRKPRPRSCSQLHKIPGRMFRNGASEVASLFTQQGRKGINQDAMIVWENFGSRNDTVFCGVFDGHGPYGHMVSQRVRDILPLKLNAKWETHECKETTISNFGSFNSEASSTLSHQEESRASNGFEENNEHSQMYITLKDPLLKAFRIVDRELQQHSDINCFYSGTTAVALIKQGNELVIGNVGDSRAVLGTRYQNDALTAVQLTVDLKPNLPSEAERIRKSRGRVFALKDEPEVARVWLPNKDLPGLAMARALGDFCLKDFGLISIPEISYWHITERDEFVVLATDGVWDVLSNKQVVDIIASAPARSSAAQFLVESAVKAWRSKYPTSRIDDCAVVCLFLNPDASNISFNHTPKEVESLAESDEEHSGPASVDRPNTIHSGTDSLQDGKLLSNDDTFSMHGDDVSMRFHQGVSRVDTLLSLPRFVADSKQPSIKI